MIEKVKEAIDKIEYVCPVCKNDLVIRPKEYFCDRCSLILKYFVAQRPEYKNYRYMYPNLSDDELKNEVAMMLGKSQVK